MQNCFYLFETTQPKSYDFTIVVAALKLNTVFNHEIKERWMFESMMQLCLMSILVNARTYYVKVFMEFGNSYCHLCEIMLTF